MVLGGGQQATLFLEPSRLTRIVSGLLYFSAVAAGTFSLGHLAFRPSAPFRSLVTDVARLFHHAPHSLCICGHCKTGASAQN